MIMSFIIQYSRLEPFLRKEINVNARMKEVFVLFGQCGFFVIAKRKNTYKCLHFEPLEPSRLARVVM
jgi:hypothetical protein